MTILCYHSVQPDWVSPLAVEPRAFAAQCAWLARHRRVLPLEEALPRLDRSWRLPRGHAVLTFDDGFAALHEHALPVLLRHRMPATVFLVAETLTPQGRRVDWVDTPPPYPLRTLTSDQVLEMQEAGVAFASHSYSHFDLTSLTLQECVADLRRSRELLEDLLRQRVPYLAYPRGRHDETVRTAAAQAGYARSFSLPERREHVGPHAVPRVGVYQHNGQRTFRTKTLRSYLSVRTGAAWGTARKIRDHLAAGRSPTGLR